MPTGPHEGSLHRQLPFRAGQLFTQERQLELADPKPHRVAELAPHHHAFEIHVLGPAVASELNEIDPARRYHVALEPDLNPPDLDALVDFVVHGA